MLDELFKEEGQSIFSFKKGDIIIRVESAKIRDTKYNDNLGIEIDVAKYTDNSFRTEPKEFVGVSQNTIYLRELKSFLGSFRLVKLTLEDWEEGWQLFKVPDGLTMDDILNSIT